MMTRPLTVAALSLALTAGAALANQVVLNDATSAKIKETLTAQGYTVGKIHTEDGFFEAYGIKDGKKFEIYLNDKLEVVRTEQDY